MRINFYPILNLADNTTLNTGTGGDVIATDDIGGVKFQRVKMVVGADGVNGGDVASANPLPSKITDGTNSATVLTDGSTGYGLGTSLMSTNFVASTGNSTTAQLAASATFTGTIESVFNQQTISLLLTSDQNGTLTIKQYIDSGGTRLISSWAISIVAGTPFSRAFTANGNYFNLTFQNTGGSTTTTLRIDTAYGTLTPSTNLGNVPNSLNEVNGTAISLGQGTMAASLPVAIASNQTSIPVTDNSGSLTVDAPVGTPVFVRLSDGASAISALPITDNSGSLTVDNLVSTPLFVQPANSNRTDLRFYAVAAAAGTTGTETAITLTKSSGTSATTTGTSFVITSGKRFKITHLSFATRGNATATVQSTTFNFRINTAGAVTTTSTPIILSARSATPATASAWDRYVVTLPADGLEIVGDGTLQFGITAAATYTTNAPTWDVVLIGYEY